MSDIERAAEDMRLAASSFSNSVDRLAQVQRDLEFTLINHQRFLRSFLEDMQEELSGALETAMKEPAEEKPKKTRAKKAGV